MLTSLIALALASAPGPATVARGDDCAPGTVAPGTMAALVVDQASELPVPNVTVVVAWAEPGDTTGASLVERRSRTDSSGRARFCRLPRHVTVTTWAIAGTARTPRAELRFAGVDTVAVTFRLAAQAVRALEEVRVVAAPAQRPSEFDERLRRGAGGGQFMDEARIVALGRTSITELARSFASVHMADAGLASGPVLSTTRAGRSCPINVFVDGTPVSQVALDGIVTPELLHGVEYYPGFASPPAKYTAFTRSGCGTLLLWTKSELASREDAKE